MNGLAIEDFTNEGSKILFLAPVKTIFKLTYHFITIIIYHYLLLLLIIIIIVIFIVVLCSLILSKLFF